LTKLRFLITAVDNMLMPTFYFQHGGATDIGRHREKNEDALLVHKGKKLFVVADGVGGNQHGEVASAAAVRTVGVHFRPEQPWSIARAFQKAHEAVQKLRKQKSSDMATTLTGFHVEKNGIIQVAHCGDSELYRLRDGVLKKLTQNHDAYNPKKNRTEMYWAVGASQFGFDHFAIDAQHGDVFLLCTDGLHGAGDKNVANTLTKCADGKLTAHRAASELIKLANAAGGYDNTTAVVVKVLERKKKKITA
jgi:protein phosphatase